MNSAMATSKTPRKKRTTEVVHICIQEETLARHGVLLERQGTVLLGNGHPEDGLLFMFREFLERERNTGKKILPI